MSFNEVKRTIEEFIKTDKNDFLAIKGSWGVGKTFFWQQLIKRLIQSDEVGMKGQIYVSLFGLRDIDSLRELVTASFLEQKVTKRNIFGSETIKMAKQVEQLVREFPYIRHLPLRLGSTLASLYVRDILICFDDFDRKDESLTEKQFFGFAAQLKEERNCKIAFIFNNEALPQEQDQFETQNEKVLDRTVSFEPEPEDVFEFAFEPDYKFYEVVKESCLKLKIRNIRILKRIRFAIDDVVYHMAGVEPTIVEHCIKFLIIFTWSRYDKESGPPSLATLETFSFFNRLRPGFNELSDDQQKKVIRESKLLEEYGYTGIDDLGRLLVQYIKNGFLQLEAFQSSIREKSKNLQVDERKQKYRKLWDEFRTGLVGDEETFVKRLLSALHENIGSLELHEIDSPISLLRQFEQDAEANAFVDLYCSQHRGRFIQYFRRGHIDFSMLRDPYARNKIAELSHERDEPLSLQVILKEIGSNSSLEIGQLHFAANQTTEDFIQAIKDISDTDAGYYAVRHCLSFSKENDEKIAQISTKILQALRQIVSESRMQRVRIKWIYNIDFDLSDEEILKAY
jgi:hypothetical protein